MLRALAWLAVAVAGVVLAVRGVGPGLSFSGDFTMIHAGATAWLSGADLYDFDTLYDAWQANGGGAERPREERWFVALYPPTTYAVLGPLGALSWQAGRAAWVLISLLSIAGVAFWGRAWLVPRPSNPLENDARPAQDSQGEPTSFWSVGLILLLGAWLSFGPVATTLRFGQLGLPVLGLVVLALGTPQWRPPTWLAGVALAVAGCLKPQLAGVFACGFVALGRWRELGWTVGVGLAVAAVAVLRLEAAGVSWATGLLDNLHRFAGTGFADPSPANSVAWQLVNLEPLWRRFATGGAGLGVFAVLAASAGGVAWRRVGQEAATTQTPTKERPTDLTLWVMSVAAVVTLLIAYHRAYDAVLLAVPAVWAVRSWASGRRWQSALVLAGVAAFWAPLPELLNHLAHRGRLPASETWPFALETAVMFHRNALLVAMWLVLLVSGGSRRDDHASRHARHA